MPNLPRLSQVPFISPTNNTPLIPCFMDEVHAVSYLALSITGNCLQRLASVFKVISLQPLMSDERTAQPVEGVMIQRPQQEPTSWEPWSALAQCCWPPWSHQRWLGRSCAVQVAHLWHSLGVLAPPSASPWWGIAPCHRVSAHVSQFGWERGRGELSFCNKISKFPCVTFALLHLNKNFAPASSVARNGLCWGH